MINPKAFLPRLFSTQLKASKENKDMYVENIEIFFYIRNNFHI